MKRSIAIHIGANKTGSSAIQRFLQLNAPALGELGWTVPDGEMSIGGRVSGAQVSWFVSLANKPHGHLAERIRDLMNKIPAPGGIVISAENLSNPGYKPDDFTPLASDFDLRIVLYIRRQDELILSSWQQWQSKVSVDFWAWATRIMGVEGNWQLVLEKWERVIPRENISVRIYERSRFPQGDINRDFLGQLGLTPQADKFVFPRNAINPSYTDAVVELVKGNRALFENVHDNRFYNTLETLTGSRFHRDRRESTITFAQRLSLLTKYADSNAWVCQRYFPGQSELFVAPTPRDYVYVDQARLEEKKWEVVMTLLYALAKRIKT
jgi:hypothetical protein